MEPAIHVVIPCYNEEPTIGKVVADFRRVLPGAKVHVFDNVSTDATAEVAADAGAIIHRVRLRGKGQVVSTIIETVPADVFLMVDGDDTYPAEEAPKLLAPVLAGRADMVVGARLDQHAQGAFRPLHIMGNRLVRALTNLLFGGRLSDIMSGYRAFTAELARNVPVTAVGFEIETELTALSLYYGFAIEEVPIPYRSRPPGSASKLRTFSDGARILWTILKVFRCLKPLSFYGLLAAVAAVAGIACALPGAWRHYCGARGEGAPLAVGIALLAGAAVLLGMGLLAQTMNRRLREVTSLTRKTPGSRERH